MNNTYINFHLYGLDVYLTYVYISTHRELGTSKDYLRLTRKLKEKYQFLTIFTSNTDLQTKTLKDCFSLKREDSRLKVHRSANISASPLINRPPTGSKELALYRDFTYNLGNSTKSEEATYIAKGGKTL